MYQPQRVATAATPATVAPAFAGPRRAQRRRSEVVAARMAPTAVSLALITTAGALALTQRPAEGTTTTTDASTLVREDAPSRAAARALVSEPTPAPTASQTPDAQHVVAWSTAIGTVVGELHAQDATQVLARPAADAAPITQLAKGQKVQVTDLTTAGFRQVVIENRAGYVAADVLGEQAPKEAAAKDATDKPAAGTEAGSGKLFWPTEGNIGSPWGMRFHPILHYVRMHGGVDIGAPTGQPIYAAADGVVTKAETGYNSGSGTNVRIDHGKITGKKLETAYLHMSKYVVKVGDKVTRGQLIGYVGSTGLSTSPHLHFSVYVNGTNSNPADWISH